MLHLKVLVHACEHYSISCSYRSALVGACEQCFRSSDTSIQQQHPNCGDSSCYPSAAVGKAQRVTIQMKACLFPHTLGNVGGHTQPHAFPPPLPHLHLFMCRAVRWHPSPWVWLEPSGSKASASASSPPTPPASTTLLGPPCSSSCLPTWNRSVHPCMHPCSVRTKAALRSGAAHIHPLHTYSCFLNGIAWLQGAHRGVCSTGKSCMHAWLMYRAQLAVMLPILKLVTKFLHRND